jgi:hypothetical protein
LRRTELRCAHLGMTPGRRQTGRRQARRTCFLDAQALRKREQLCLEIEPQSIRLGWIDRRVCQERFQPDSGAADGDRQLLGVRQLGDGGELTDQRGDGALEAACSLGVGGARRGRDGVAGALIGQLHRDTIQRGRDRTRLWPVLPELLSQPLARAGPRDGRLSRYGHGAICGRNEPQHERRTRGDDLGAQHRHRARSRAFVDGGLQSVRRQGSGQLRPDTARPASCPPDWPQLRFDHFGSDRPGGYEFDLHSDLEPAGQRVRR